MTHHIPSFHTLTNTEQLTFPRESGIFYHHLEGQAFLTQNPHHIPLSRSAWIFNLLHNRPRGLTSLQMSDPPGAVGFYFWETMHWSPPHVDGVDVDVWFSYPQPEDDGVSRYNKVAPKCKPRYWNGCEIHDNYRD